MITNRTAKKMSFNPGIVGIEVYFPKRYVSQEELEEYYGYPKGKITIGIGQSEMAVCDDREDVCSICLTVVRRCLQKYNVDPRQIGRLEVGTETLIDKSKSVKSVLMQLFQDSGNNDIEGVDNVNACYGGTNAFLNSINWMESSSWDGRYALMVAADIAVYEKGPARPSGGAAAIAILLGPDAPIVMTKLPRATYMENVYDFYKPLSQTEFPIVDGRFSLICYLKAFDKCYTLLMNKAKKVSDSPVKSVSDIDFILCHAPFYKLVIKASQRVLYNEYLMNKMDPGFESLREFDSISGDDLYLDKNFEGALMALSKKYNIFDNKVVPGLSIAKRLGNSYSASVWVCLANLLFTVPSEELQGKNILLYSYGSGLAASAFFLSVKRPTDKIRSVLNLDQRLSERTMIKTSEFEKMLVDRQNTFKPDYTPVGEVNSTNYFSGTYYLDKIDDKYRRTYSLFE